MDVTEFLRARLAEDEEALLRDARTLDEPHGPGPATRPADPVALRRRRAELGAKRAILELHQGLSDIWGFHGCLTCGNVADTTAGYPCPTVRELAAVYDDHPAYDEAWRPR
ncbi:DUF6221 family protein [Georgenia sp. SUBG003]|uniref:DUF6221 family protein n=1 Tax=Georgenia sp. SUBG003 TaxID=1497974 RepID=UPI0006944D6B